jgi:hypothetical protein
MKHPRLNGDHAICRPLRGLGNSCAVFPGLTPALYAVAHSARFLTHVPSTWVSQLCTAFETVDGDSQLESHHAKAKVRLRASTTIRTSLMTCERNIGTNHAE